MDKASFEATKKANPMKQPVKAKATYGTPRFVHLAKILGAFPSLAIP
jgi:hypothetical protein